MRFTKVSICAITLLELGMQNRPVLIAKSQAGLTENPEAGRYMRAFLGNGRSLPVWPVLPSHQQVTCPNLLNSCVRAQATFSMFTEQIQVALNMKRAIERQPIGSQE